MVFSGSGAAVLKVPAGLGAPLYIGVDLLVAVMGLTAVGLATTGLVFLGAVVTAFDEVGVVRNDC